MQAAAAGPDAQADETLRRFAPGPALLRRLDAVRHRVAHEVQQRLLQTGEHRAVESRRAAGRLKPYAFAEGLGGVACRVFQENPEHLGRNQPQAAGVLVQPLQIAADAFHPVAETLAGAVELGDEFRGFGREAHAGLGGAAPGGQGEDAAGLLAAAVQALELRPQRGQFRRRAGHARKGRIHLGGLQPHRVDERRDGPSPP